MKRTIIMLSAIGTFAATWLCIGTVGYLLSDDVSFKEVMRDVVVLMMMFVVGWIPSVIVCNDLDIKLE